MVFTEDMLDKEGVVKHHNGGPTVNAKVTYGPAFVQMLASKPVKTFHNYEENIFTPPPTSSVDFGVCEKKGHCMGRLFPWQPKSRS